MNTRFTFAFIRHLDTRRHSGFAVPIALVMGMAIVLAGVMMIVRAQGDQSKVVSQKANQVAMAAAEAGMARIQSFLATNPALAQYSMEEWKSAIISYQTNNPTNSSTYTPTSASDPQLAGAIGLLKQQSCSYSGQSNASVASSLVPTMAGLVSTSGSSATGVENTLTNPDSSNSNFSPSFQLKGYKYSSNGQAEAVITGMAGQGATKQAKSTLAVTIPVSSSSVDANTQGFPGLWVKQYLRAGQNDNNPGTINAHVIYDCGISAGTFTSTPQTNGSANGYTYHVSSGTANGGTAIRVALPTGNPAPEKSLIPMPNPPTSAPSGVSPYSLGDLASGSTTLPRAGETPVNGIYYYTASSISGNTTKLTFTRGSKFVVFLSGNINIGGSSQITHDCQSTANSLACDATDVQILGSTSNTNGSFITKGNSAVCSIFFWAPSYTVEMSGGGNAGDCADKINSTSVGPSNQPANQNGIYWVKAWIGGGQGVHQALNQSGSSWNAVKSVASLPSMKIGNPTGWAMKPDGYTPTLTQTTPSTNIATINPPTGTCTLPNLSSTAIPLTDVNSTAKINQAILAAGFQLGTANLTTNTSTPISTTSITRVYTIDPTTKSETTITANGTGTMNCSTVIAYDYSLANGLIPSSIIGSNSNTNSITSTISAIPISGTTTPGCFVVGTGVNSTNNPKVKSISFAPVGGTALTYGTTTGATAFPTGGVYATCGLPINYIY